MCKKDKTQVKQTYEVFSYIQYITTLFDRACMYINISYINMCRLNKNTVEGIKESQVFDSLQNGIIISLPFRNG